MQELKNNANAYFITLTYDEESIPIVNILTGECDIRGKTSDECIGTLRKKDVQDFLKRLRSRISPRKIRYYLCGEYGTRTSRPHYHAIIFGDENLRRARLPSDIPTSVEQLIRDCWQLDGKTIGFTDVQDITDNRIYYVAKYITKSNTNLDGLQPPFSLMSRKPAIGDSYTKYASKDRPFVVNEKGHKLALPRYYKKKLKENDQWLKPWQTKQLRENYERKQLRDYYDLCNSKNRPSPQIHPALLQEIHNLDADRRRDKHQIKSEKL